MSPSDYVRAARPKQWAKNLLVFAAPGALGVLNQGAILGRTAAIFFAFCACSGGLYVLNDVRDIEKDRLHPRKRSRPIAAGVIPMRRAVLFGTLLTASGFVSATLVDLHAGMVLGVYAVVTLGYSLGLKAVPLLELLMVASGFVLRAVAGAAATSTKMSQWFLLCTMFGSLFVVAGKRYAECREFGEDASRMRASLSSYSATFLQLLLVVASSVTVVAYVLWAFEGARSSELGIPLYEASIAPLLLALLRYLQLLESGHGGSPEDIFLGDRAIEVYSLAWLLIYGAAVYGR